MPYAVPLDEVAGQETAEGTGAAGDEDGARRCEGRRGGRRPPGSQPGEARRARYAVAHGHLRFAGGEDGAEHGVEGRRVGGPLQVEQQVAAGLFGLRGTHQAADRRLFGVGVGVLGDDDEPGVRGAVVGRPGRQGAEDVTAGAQDHGRGDRSGAGEFGVVGPRGRRRRVPVERHPVDPVQGAAGRGGERVRGDGPGAVAPDGGHRAAVRGGQAERDAVGPGRGDPDPQFGGTRRVQGVCRPREGQARPAPGRVAARRVCGEVGQVQGRVEEGGVQAEGRGGRRQAGGQGDVGEHLLAVPPRRAHPPEGGAVLVALGGEFAVQVLDGQRPGGRGRPGVGGGRRRARGVLGRGRQRPAGVPVPGVLGCRVPGAGVQFDRPAPRRARLAQDDLDGGATVFGQGQRAFEGELLHVPAAHPVARADGQLQQCGPGQEHRPGDRVVGQPGVGVEREPAGQHGAGGVRERERRAQQRVSGNLLAQPGGVGGGGRGEPVAAGLEGVAGQLHGGRGAPAAVEQGGPVDGRAPDVGGGERRQELPLVVGVAP